MPKEKFYTSMNTVMFNSIFFETEGFDFLKALIEKTLERKVEIKKASKKMDLLTKEENSIFVETENDYIEIVLNRKNDKNRRLIKFRKNWDRYKYDLSTAKNRKEVKNYIQINITEGLSNDVSSLAKYGMSNKQTNEPAYEDFIVYEYNVDKILNEVNACSDEYAFIAMLKSDKEKLSKICKGDKIMERYQKEIEELNQEPEIVKAAQEEEEKEEPKVINVSISVAAEN